MGSFLKFIAGAVVGGIVAYIALGIYFAKNRPG